MLDFSTYQKQAMTTAVYPGRGEGNWIYPALGLAGAQAGVVRPGPPSGRQRKSAQHPPPGHVGRPG